MEAMVMQNKRLKTRISMLTAAMVMLGGTAVADDTELYVGSTAAGTQSEFFPNVLLILDTSSSMNDEVITTEPYNPGQVYTGDCTDGSADKIFWRRTSGSSSSIPDCDSSRWFDSSRLRCLGAIEALNNDTSGSVGPGPGYYTDRIARWRNSSGTSNDYWTTLSTSVNYPNHVECRSDNGDHGETASGPHYVRNYSSGPYSSSEDTTIWSSAGNYYQLYSANYLNWYHYHSVIAVQTRLEIVQQVALDTIASVSGLNIGLMRFDPEGHYNCYPDNCWYNDHEGGPVLVPVGNAEDSTQLAALQSAINGLTPDGSTPLVETAYEGYLMFAGQTADYGNRASNALQSDSDSMDNGVYISPIQNECAENFMVILSDGLPTGDESADDEINALLSAHGGLTLGSCAHGVNYPVYWQSPFNEHEDSCLDELAEFMFEQQESTSVFPEGQRVTTFTVGWDIGDLPQAEELLRDTAEAGGGEFFASDDSTSLANAFSDIISEILAVNTTFTAPAVAVNSFNRIRNNQELYFAIFEPAETPHWNGNVKRFKLGALDGEVAIVDLNGNSAVDPSTGFFSDDAISFWTPSTALDEDGDGIEDRGDGGETGAGGLASRLYDLDGSSIPQAATRNVYTYTATVGGSGTIMDLTDPANALHLDNAFLEYQGEDSSDGDNAGDNNADGKVTPAMLALTVSDEASEDVFKQMVEWASGIDVLDHDDDGDTTEGRTQKGAPLHSRPILVTFSNTGPSPADEFQFDVLFTIDNDGIFHATLVHEDSGVINITNKAGQPGIEIFAFMPQELLSNIEILFSNTPGSNADPDTTIQYGLDGGIEVWIKDHDSDGEIELPDQDGNYDHVYIYFSQRRGGNGVYALDVSDPFAPEFLWSVVGGVTAGFDELSQSWSRPAHATIPVVESGTLVLKDVIIFGGGYDDIHDLADNSRDPAGDTVGRAIYIVDAEDGSLIWWAGPTGLASPPDLALADLKYSIPSEVAVVDTNADGIEDLMVVGDMGGQVFRFDIENNGDITGGIIADLQLANASDTPTAANNRLFYYRPDVSFVETPGGTEVFAFALGSGYRAHPLNTTTEEYFFVLKDSNTMGPPPDNDLDGNPDYVKVYVDDLYDVTDLPNLDIFSLDENDATDANALAQLAKGWYLELRDVATQTADFDGEKVAANAIIFDNKVLFTTFIPFEDDGSAVTCADLGGGSGRTYAIDLGDGSAVENLDDEGTTASFARSDRFSSLSRSGLPPEPTLVFPPELVDNNGASVNPGPITLVGAEIVPVTLQNDPEGTYWRQHEAH